VAAPRLIDMRSEQRGELRALVRSAAFNRKP
jgi:hypothetical protein